MTSCENDNQYQPSPTDVPIEFREPAGPPVVPGESILGDELENPYDVNNMEEANELLTGLSIQYNPTHYYIKFLPQIGKHIILIEMFEEAYGYEFETQPIHFEVLAEGMEEYVDPEIGDEGFSPEYGAVKAADFGVGHFPNVPHLVLNEMYMPAYENRLTFTAFVISGNEQYYEAIDGLCHPDCPTWPSCLDDPSLTCQVGPTIEYIPTIDPVTAQPKQNFPGYILDEDLGYHGEIEETSGRIPIIPDTIDCPEGCIPILDVAPIGLSGFFWDCDCSDDWDDDGGVDGPPSGQVSKCGCYVYDDKRKPGGKMSVLDTQFPEPEGIRTVKMMTAPRYFGFIWHNTNTDDDGCWKIDKRYNVKNLKIKPVFKDRVTDRMVIRSLRGVRFWNAFLKPVKHKFLENRNNKEWHSLCLLLDDDADDDSRDEQSYVAALTNNSIHEYYDDFSTMPSPGKIKVLIHNWGDDGNAAPMFSEIDQDQFTILDITQFLSMHTIPFVGLLYDLWEWSKPDVILSFGDNKESDLKRSTVYHEMTHVSQYAVAGPEWWESYIRYIIGVALTNQPRPYGDGSSPGAGLAELTEGMASAFARVVSDAKYELEHSNGTPSQFFRYSNLGERLLYWDDATEFIPRGLFFDLYDQNGVFPNSVSISEAPGIIDNAFGFPFEDQVQVFAPNVNSIESFQDQLWLTYGAGSGSTFANYSLLFDSYGH